MRLRKGDKSGGEKKEVDKAKKIKYGTKGR